MIALNKFTANAIKTASKREIKKKAGETAVPTGYLIDNKLADIRASFSKKKQKNSSLSLEKRQQITLL